MRDPAGSLRVVRRRGCCALLLGAVVVACASPTDASSSDPIRVVAGGEQTDTINAWLSQPLIVEIRDSESRIAPSRTVRFRQIIPAEPRPAALLVGPIGGDDYTSFGALATDLTDRNGRARSRIRFLSRAGTALLEVSVPALDIVDTVAYTIRPGAPTRFEASPDDTTIVVGASFTVRATLTDQSYNPVPGAAPTFSATGVSVSPSGEVSADAAIARAPVRVRYGEYIDSVMVSAVPQLRLVYNRVGSVMLVNSDGTGLTTLATTTSERIAPSSVAATPSVVFHQGDPSTNARLWVVEPNGTPRPLLAATSRPDAWPRLSQDGVWVYFVRDMTTLWRVRLDGTGLDSLASFVPTRLYRAPTVSSDGGSVAIEDATGLKIVDVATKATRTLPVSCPNPRYSPDGAFFACAGFQDVSIVRADGTGQRIVATFSDGRTHDALSGLDWTPDGKWMLALVYGLTLIEVSSGSLIAMTSVNGNVFEPSFVR